MSTRRLSLRSFAVFYTTVLLAVWSHGQPDPDSSLRAGRNVNMVSGTVLPGGDPWLQRQNEPSLAVSTRNPLHILAGANDYRTVDFPESEGELSGMAGPVAAGDAWLGIFKSLDGGRSWTNSLLPGFPQDNGNSPLKKYGAAADATVRAGTNGLFYYSGIAFNRISPELSAIFLVRLIDNNNSESSDPIAYIDTKVLDTGTPGRFLDMPSIAVDKPRGFRTVPINGQTIPASNVYLVYPEFRGPEHNVIAALNFIRSTDCGQTWGKPIKLSNGGYPLQGARIAVDPASGSIYIVWRRFAAGKLGDAIEFVKSVDYGNTFSSPAVVSDIVPFDQGAKDATTSPPAGTAFRTNSYPTIAVDSQGFVHCAWAQKDEGAVAGESKIVMSNFDGASWSAPQPIDDVSIAGHQFMPALTFAAGELTLVWYDQRNSAAQSFSADYINDDPSVGVRQTLDVFAAQALSGRNPIFHAPLQVSRYEYALGDDGHIYQAQFNPPNYPLFRGGTTPFHGDYLDVAPSPAFILDGNNNWQFNTGATSNSVFHLSWTDNRDVHPPDNNDWTTYNPPNSVQTGFGTGASCKEPLNVGMRNQNIYSARLTRETEAGSYRNNKPLGTVGYFPGGMALVPRAFVIYVRNNTWEIRSYRLKITGKPHYGNASFEEFSQVDSLDVLAAPNSTIARTVFAASTNTGDAFQISVFEIVNGSEVLAGTVVLNQDPTVPTIPAGDSLATSEIYTPTISNLGNPNIVNWTAVNPNIVNPNILNPNIINPNIINPNIINPNILNLNILNPNIVNPNIVNPNILNPNIVNPNIINPNILNPNIVNPNIVNGAVSDVNWAVINSGNTTSIYNLKLYSKEQLPVGVYAQLVVYRESYTPASYTAGAGGDPCDLKVAAQHDVILNITNPNIVNPNIVNPNILNPNIVNSAVENAIFAVGPGEKINVTVRVVDTTPGIQRTVSRMVYDANSPSNLQTVNAIFDVQTFLDSLSMAVVADAVNTDDAEEGILSPPVAVTSLVISTDSLPDAFINEQEIYNAQLSAEATGGTDPLTWSLNAGELPPGLSITSDGLLTGSIPSGSEGIYYFVVLVADNATGEYDIQRFSIYVNASSDPGSPDPLAILTGPALRNGVKDYWYGTTLEAVGGASPRTWTFVGGPLPQGLNFLNGTITGTPKESGTFTFTAEVKDASEPANSVQQQFTIIISDSQINATTTISGRVYDSEGNGLSGVSIYGLPSATTTDENGDYSTTVPDGWSGELFPFKPGYYFSPSSRIYNSLSADQSDQDYSGIIALPGEKPPAAFAAFEVAEPANIFVGIPFEVTITAIDSTGNITTNVSGPTTLTVDGVPQLIPDTAFIDTGIATVTVTLGQDSTLTVDNSGKTGSSSPISVQSWNLSFDSAGPSDGTSGQNLSGIRVRASDLADAPIAGVPVTVSIGASGCSYASLTGTAAVTTESDGWADFPDLQLDRGGWGYVLRATAGSPEKIVDSVAFNIIGSCETENLGHALNQSAAALLPNGKVLVAGGYDGANILSSAELYDPAGGTWEENIKPMNEIRFNPTATLLRNGKVLVAGGTQAGDPSLAYASASAEIYDPSTDTWRPTGSMMQSRAGHTATLLPGGNVLVAGGWWTSTAELYDPSTDTWRPTGSMTVGRSSSISVLLPNGKVLVAGAINSTGTLSSAELYDPSTGTWRSTLHPMVYSRIRAAATLLKDGRVLVVGGYSLVNNVYTYYSGAEIYNPSKDEWTPAKSMHIERSWPTATLLKDGKVLVAGGNVGAEVFSNAEIYDPSTDEWTLPIPLVSGRVAPIAVLLPDERILFAGGYNNGELKTAELFYPSPAQGVPSGSHLAFMAEPPTTGTVFNQTIPPVSVQIQETDGNPIAMAGVNIEMVIGDNPSGGSLSGTLAVATDSSGTATFDDLKISKAGNGYTLMASAQFGGPSVTSGGFDIMAGAGVITTVAGKAWTWTPPASGLANDAHLGLGFTGGIAADGAGNVYIADPQNNMIFKESGGMITPFAGTGRAGFSGDNAMDAGSAMLNNPQAVAIGQNGNVYIADSYNGRIRRVDANGSMTTIAIGFAASGLVYDGQNNYLYISSFAHQVLRLTLNPDGSGGTRAAVAGAGTAGYSGDNGDPLQAQLYSPQGLALDAAGNLYIADSQNHVVRKVDFGVNTITTVAGNGIRGFSEDGGIATASSLDRPAGVAVDDSGNLYISDLGSNRIRMVDSDGSISTVAGNGTFAYSGDNGPASSASLANQSGIALVDSTLYIVDGLNKRVRSITPVAPSGTINTIAGSGRFKFSGDEGPAADAVLGLPYGIALDSSGNIYIAENDNQVVRKVEASSETISTVVGTGDLNSPSGDGGPASDATLSFPRGVALDSAGNNLYVNESFYRALVRKVDLANAPKTISTVADPLWPWFDQMAVDAAGNVYAANEGNFVVKIDTLGTVTAIAGSSAGQAGFDGDGGPPVDALLSAPSGVAVSPDVSIVYIADTNNNRIRRIAGGIITTIAGTGAYGFSGDNGPAEAANLAGPWGLALDASGDLYVADAGNNRVRKISNPEGPNPTITTVAGNGASGFWGDNGGATAAALSAPRCVAIGPDGNLYIADTQNGRIRMVMLQ